MNTPRPRICPSTFSYGFGRLLFTSLKGVLIKNQWIVRVVGKGAVVFHVDSKKRKAGFVVACKWFQDAPGAAHLAKKSNFRDLVGVGKGCDLASSCKKGYSRRQSCISHNEQQECRRRECDADDAGGFCGYVNLPPKPRKTWIFAKNTSQRDEESTSSTIIQR